jgi:hypothetical protein
VFAAFYNSTRLTDYGDAQQWLCNVTGTVDADGGPVTVGYDTAGWLSSLYQQREAPQLQTGNGGAAGPGIAYQCSGASDPPWLLAAWQAAEAASAGATPNSPAVVSLAPPSRLSGRVDVEVQVLPGAVSSVNGTRGMVTAVIALADIDGGLAGLPALADAVTGAGSGSASDTDSGAIDWLAAAAGCAEIRVACVPHAYAAYPATGNNATLHASHVYRALSLHGCARQVRRPAGARAYPAQLAAGVDGYAFAFAGSVGAAVAESVLDALETAWLAMIY